METKRRRDYRNFAVFIQKFEDFIDNTTPYRRKQDEKFDLLFTEIKAINEKLLMLPCPSRKQLWDAKMETIAKDSSNQWKMIGALWTVIAACAYSIFETWVKLWSGGK